MMALRHEQADWRSLGADGVQTTRPRGRAPERMSWAHE
jgi:hypothetical protein